MRGNHFMELRAFELVARRLSFSRAASDLGVSKAALSQIVKNLEQRVGVRLLNRTTRSVALTDAGSELLARLSPALLDLVNAVDNIEKFRNRPSGIIRIKSCQLGIDMHLKPILGIFSKELPEISLEINIQDGDLDMVANGFDAAIRPEGQIDLDLIGVKIGKEHKQVFVTSPQYLELNGTPQDHTDLRSHKCVSVRQSKHGQSAAWRYSHDGRFFAIEPKGPLIVNDYKLAMEAVTSGWGISLVPMIYAEPHLQSGRATQILKDCISDIPPFYLCYPKQELTTYAFRSFVDFIKQHSKLPH